MPRQLEKGEEPPFPRPKGPWKGRVQFAPDRPFAFRPRQVVCIGDDARAAAELLIRENKGGEARSRPIFGENFLVESTADFDVLKIVAALRLDGFRTEPNYVFFLHGACGCAAAPCGCGRAGLNPFTPNPFTPNPFTPNPFTPNPFTPNPFTPNPFTPNGVVPTPFTPNPFTPNPFTPNNFAASGVRSSSALPADPPAHPTSITLPEPELDDEGNDPDMVHVWIYDTGVSVIEHLPPLLENRDQHKLAHETDRDSPDEPNDKEGIPKDGLLDPVAGHGSFIAGIFEQLVPGRDVNVSSIFSTFGDTDMATITARMEEDLGEIDQYTGCRTVVNLSFGAYADQEMYLLAEAVLKLQEKGVTVVASAGNDSVSWPSFPAALPGVIGVASVDECGRAPYSNFGDWVDACAPGSAVVSSFFHSFDGKRDPIPGVDPVDPDNFAGWAAWSGTSFAAPLVAAALVRHMTLHKTTGPNAVKAIITAPELLQLPGLGTVVNIRPGM